MNGTCVRVWVRLEGLGFGLSWKVATLPIGESFYLFDRAIVAMLTLISIESISYYIAGLMLNLKIDSNA